MALSDFLEQQASAALEHSREKENQRLLRQEERKDRLNEELSQYASRAIEVLNIEIEQASEKVKQIAEMPMPSTSQECMKMIAECERKIALPIKNGTAASIMENMPDNDTNIDFAKPSKMIHNAWEDRLNEIIDFAKTEFPDDENFNNYLKKAKRKKISLIILIVSIITIFAVGIFLIVHFTEKKKNQWYANFEQALAEQEYSAAVAMVPEQWGEDGFLSENDKFYTQIIDKMIKDENYEDAIDLAITKDLNYSDIKKCLINIGESYLKSHSKQQTKRYLKSVVPASCNFSSNLLKDTYEALDIK